MAQRLTMKQRYLRRVVISMAAYIVSLFGANYLIDNHLVGGPVTWLLALLPGLAVVGFIFAIGMYIVEQEDEYLRMLMVRQVLLATGLTLSLATIWGFLEDFELVGHLELFWVVVVWCFALPVGAAVNRLTHGTWGACW